MTTTITVETHDWPVAVTTNDNHSHTSPERVSNGYTETVEFVPANSKRQFYVTDARSLSFRELPKGATGLYDEKIMGLTGFGSMPNQTNGPCVAGDMATAGLDTAEGGAA